jgi:hypothetical protein
MLSFNKFLESKSEDRKGFLNKWASLQPRPIPLQPKPYGHYGTSLDEDTIRITGSEEFIESILAKLKDLLIFENKDIKLDVDFKPSKYSHAGGSNPNYEFKFSATYRDPAKKIPMGPRIIPQ